MNLLLLVFGLLSQTWTTAGPVLRVDLQEGFEGCGVALFLDGLPVFRDSVRTDPVKGLAGGADLECRSTLVDLRVRIRELGLDSTFRITIGEGEFVGLSIADSGDGDLFLRIVQSQSPFGYD